MSVNDINLFYYSPKVIKMTDYDETMYEEILEYYNNLNPYFPA